MKSANRYSSYSTVREYSANNSVSRTISFHSSASDTRINRKTLRVSRVLPLSNTIHDYIDDMLEITSENRTPSSPRVSKLLPLPNTIHDYIDDMLELTSKNIKGMYFNYAEKP